MTHIAERVGFDRDEFYSRFWRTEPVVYRGLAAAVLSPAMTVEEAESIREALPVGDARLVSRADNQVYFINQVQDYSDRLGTACARFAERLGWPHCTADLSVTYAAGGGIGPHFDDSDNFVVQQLGEKSWQVGRPSDTPEDDQRRRMLNVAGFIPRARLTPAMPSARLLAGDVLYIPLFAPHCGEESGTGTAVSMSFTHNAENILTRYLAPALEYIRNDPRWWGALPLNVNDQDAAAAVASLNQALSDAIKL